MNNRLIPEQPLGQAVTQALLSVNSVLRAERIPKGDMKAEALRSPCY